MQIRTVAGSAIEELAERLLSQENHGFDRDQLIFLYLHAGERDRVVIAENGSVNGYAHIRFDNFSAKEKFYCDELVWVEASENSRRSGVATALLEYVDRMEFSTGVLAMTGFENKLSLKHMPRVARRTLKAERYALIPQEFFGPIQPKEPGFYDEDGNQVSARKFFRELVKYSKATFTF
jgi:GNAT superfamily N-acetyltransferase